MADKCCCLLSLLLLLSLLTASNQQLLQQQEQQQRSRQYSAIFSFGDSLVDAGNLVASGITSNLAIGRPPYGSTFFGRPNGRCSDGRIVLDFIAQGLGLPFLPASKSPNASFAGGANFAITGATALDISFYEARGLGNTVWNSGSLHKQLQWFNDSKPSICSSPNDCKRLFGRSLFIVGEFGGNDYNAVFFAGKDINEAYSITPHIIESILNGVEILIGEGAKDLVVPGLLPIGCFPVYLSVYGSKEEKDHGERTRCLKKFNTLSWVHNAMLRREIEKLRRKHPQQRISYADLFSPVIQFILHPDKFGFKEQPPRACCGAAGEGPYNFNMTAKCGEPGATACENPSTHWSWDGIHLTDAAYGHIARGWLRGPFAEPPIIQPDAPS